MKTHSLQLAAALLVIALGGCGAKKTLTADQYFEEGSKELREGSYALAIEQYRDLLDQHPFSEHTEQAEFEIARAQYLKGACPEAVAALTDFQRRHPTSPQLAVVSYLVGQCYERQMRPPDRDQSASQHAHAYYVALAQQYPESPFAELAREQMGRCRESLAEHELLVARFYRRRGNDLASEYRLLDLVNRFGDTDVSAQALYALGELYQDEGHEERAVLAFAGVTRDHPQHELAAPAREKLASLHAAESLPSGDPVVLLKARTGRSRNLALAQAVEVPPLEAATAAPPSMGPAIDPSGQAGGPLGSGSRGPFGY
jgi:outer membrane protein assembly factor BamD